MSAIHQHILHTIAMAHSPTWVPLVKSSDINGEITGLYADGTDLYVLGWFTSFNGIPASGIAKWDGTEWSAPFPGIVAASGIDSFIRCGTTFHAIGHYLRTSGTPEYRYILVWDGTKWIRASGATNDTAYYGNPSKNIVYNGTLYSCSVSMSAYSNSHAIISKYNNGWEQAGPPLIPIAGQGYVDNLPEMLFEYNGLMYAFGMTSMITYDGSTWAWPAGKIIRANTSHSDVAVYNGELYLSGGFSAAIPTTQSSVDYTLTGLKGLMKYNGTTWSDVPQMSDVVVASNPQISRILVHNDRLYVFLSTTATVNGVDSGNVFYIDSNGAHPIPVDLKYPGLSAGDVGVVVYGTNIVCARSSYLGTGDVPYNNRGEITSNVAMLVSDKI